MKLTREQAKRHRQAEQLISLTRDLTEDEREFVLDHWQASANTGQTLDGAFFTPEGLASDMRLEIAGRRVIDLCAGIGRLAFHARDLWVRRWENEEPRELVCIERDPQYVAVGRRVLPEARWICADVLDLPGLDLGEFDTAISNPPFGSIARTGNAPGYSGPRFEYHVIALAAGIARYGCFIVPQRSAPFRLSGEPQYRSEADAECARFEARTGIRMGAGMGIDTTASAYGWIGVAPKIEVVTVDFTQRTTPEAPAYEIPAVAAGSAPGPAPTPAARSRRRPQPDAADPGEQLDLFA